MCVEQFVDLDQIEAKFWALANRSAAEREALAEERFRRLAKQFAPVRSFERAGVFRMLEERAQMQRASTSDTPGRPPALPRACFRTGQGGAVLDFEKVMTGHVDMESPVT